MADLTKFSLKYITKRLNSINISVNLQHQNPSPKPR